MCSLYWNTYFFCLFLVNEFSSYTDSEGRICCKKCDTKFKRKSGFNQHCKYTRCANSTKFECEICHKRFSRKDCWKSHLYAIHNAIKPFSFWSICKDININVILCFLLNIRKILLFYEHWHFWLIFYYLVLSYLKQPVWHLNKESSTSKRSSCLVCCVHEL